MQKSVVNLGKGRAGRGASPDPQAAPLIGHRRVRPRTRGSLLAYGFVPVEY